MSTNEQLYTVYMNAKAAFEVAAAECERSDEAAKDLYEKRVQARLEMQDLTDYMEISDEVSIEEYEAAAARERVAMDAWHDATIVATLAKTRASSAMKLALENYLKS